MNTITEKKAVGRPRRILSPSERDGFERMVQGADEDKIEDGQFYPGASALKDDEQTRKARKLLAEGQPDSLNKYECEKKEKRRNALIEFLQKNLLPRNMVLLRANNNGSQNHDFVKGSNFMAKREMSQEVVDACNEFRSLSFELYPDDPDMASTENIRPDSL